MADESSVVVVGNMGRPMASRLLKAVAATPTMFGWGHAARKG
jgi:3-hydroxyisobutyrate dehydrogenase-like beta-hydroxyacid dehydrogenase